MQTPVDLATVRDRHPEHLDTLLAVAIEHARSDGRAVPTGLEDLDPHYVWAQQHGSGDGPLASTDPVTIVEAIASGRMAAARAERSAMSPQERLADVLDRVRVFLAPAPQGVDARLELEEVPPEIVERYRGQLASEAERVARREAMSESERAREDRERLRELGRGGGFGVFGVERSPAEEETDRDRRSR